jgi:NAD(P)-dependent dehydrogenase (short-subunit alcohol dehydrogenase family)
VASTALITGAGRGIGREVARTLASEGWHVLSGVRDPKSAPPGTQPEVVDVADPGSIEALATRLRARHQRLDALVTCFRPSPDTPLALLLLADGPAGRCHH